MSEKIPGNIELRRQQSMERAFFNMGLMAVGIIGFLTDMTYVSQKYYPLSKSLGEIQQGQLDPYTEEALLASTGMVGFLLFCGVSLLAVGYRTYQYHRFQGDIEKQSKRPPTLRS